MFFPSLRGGVRRASVAVRRRTVRSCPASFDSLEPRHLLAAGPLGLNVEISPITSFVNLLQTNPGWGPATGQSGPVVLNASGDPASDATLTMDLRVNQSWNGPDPDAQPMNLSGTYHLSFNGQANLTTEYPGFSTPFTVQNQAYNAATNTTTVDLVVPSNNYLDFFGIDFNQTQATATSAINTGFSNAKLIRPGYAADSTQLYTNEFLSALKPFSALRYLDPENTNGQPSFSGTTLVTVNASQVDQTGLPWEYQVALANATSTDLWINIPQGATTDYIAAVAGIVKNGGTVGGVTYPGLNANLKVYLEYSDEVWGGIPGNEAYQEAAVQNGASNQPLSTFAGNANVYNNADGTTGSPSNSSDVYTAVGRRELEETALIGQIFQGVMGSDPSHQRLRPVLGWAENDPSFYTGALTWYQHFFGQASSAFYGMGNANYWGPTTYSSVDAIFASLASQETSFSVPETTAFTAIATFYGLANVSYEGGPSLTGDGTSAGDLNALAASRDPRMEQAILQHYEDYYAEGGGLAMMFSGPYGTWSPSNEWPLAELSEYGTPTASAKYRGAADVADAAAMPVSVGQPVGSSGATGLSVTADSINSSFATPSSGGQNYWTLNVATAGAYSLSLSTGSVPATSLNGQIEVFVNDRQVGGIDFVTPSSTINLGTLNLSQGINTVSIDTIHGNFDPANTQTVSYEFIVTSLTITPAGGTLINRATGGTASDSAGDNAGSGQGAAQAFDGSAATKWLTFANSGYLQYQFAGGASYAVTQYSLTAGSDTSSYPGRAPKSWSFLGSNDGVSWTTLDAQTNQADTVSGDTRTYTVASPGSYKYYRLNVTANNGDPIIQLAELQLLATSTTAAPTNRATGGTASDSAGDNAGSGQGSAQAFDGSAATKWLTFANSGYLQYQFGNGASYAVGQYSLTAGADTSSYPGRAPKSWSLLGSNDGVSWTTLDAQTNQADTVSGDTRTYTVASPGSYKYYRLNVTANNGDPIIQLAELQLWSS